MTKSRFYANLYALTSLAPLTEGREGVEIYNTLPVDLTEDGGIPDNPRFVTLLSVPRSIKAYRLMEIYQDAQPISTQWLTYLWIVG